MQTQTGCECAPAATGHSPNCALFFWVWTVSMYSVTFTWREAAQILQCSGLTSKDVLTCSTCCCLLILLQPPALLLTGAPCEWDVAAFGDDLYTCEINHFARPNGISAEEENCIFIIIRPVVPHYSTPLNLVFRYLKENNKQKRNTARK